MVFVFIIIFIFIINISVPIVAGITSSLGVILFSIILVVTVIVIIVLKKLWRGTQNDIDGGTYIPCEKVQLHVTYTAELKCLVCICNFCC